ncbi:Integrase core domain-containing protein [Blastococcus mobilis]|uniref:Integrase core domain-containing protein n=1 Tax=Blastococcus mobilis TaxID=1938746 RepID=A0A239A8A6_9ACTN|nr:Integrase core domain-containing protein [Blastococcus mobilis]
MRHGFIHVVPDDHSRPAYAEIRDEERGATATSVLRRAVAWFAARGVTARRVLTDNGGCYPAGTGPPPGPADLRHRPHSAVVVTGLRSSLH